MILKFPRFLIYTMICLLSLSSCKTKSVLAEANANSALSATKIIQSHYKNERDFSSMYIKASARYKDDNQTQNVTAEIRIKKDQKILVSIRFLGITMAKALITPNEVQYYEKLNQNYFAGDYTTLSRWLGTDLDFMKVQNMLIGEPMDDLKKGEYVASLFQKLYRLEGKSDVNTQKNFMFEAQNFLLKKQEIIQPGQNRNLTVSYPEHERHTEMSLPSGLSIEAAQKKGKTTISINYNDVTFNEELSFPYSVPDGYERIFID